jgi:hypothetical protein
VSGSTKYNRGGGGGPHDKLSKIEAAIENVESELLSVARRIKDLEQKEVLTPKEEALLEQLRTEKELLLRKDLLLLERGQHSGPVFVEFWV